VAAALGCNADTGIPANRVKAMRPPAIPQQGYFVQSYEQLPAGMPRHALGGPAAGDSCPTCKCAWVTLMLLDCVDARLELCAFKQGRLPLVVCLQCGESSYALASDGEIAAVPTPRGQHTSIASLDLLPPRAGDCALHAIPDRITQARELAAERRLEEAGNWAGDYDWKSLTHQVGGSLIAGRAVPSAPACPLCNERLPFFACVAVGNGREEAAPLAVCFFVCRACQSVVAKTAGPTD